MKTLTGTISALSLALILGMGATLQPVLAQESGPVFELRTYKSTAGNLENLLTRFRNHTTALFEKHGMSNVGYWVPTDPELAEDTIIYVLRHDSREAAQASWRAFASDPEWQRVNAESNANGSILQGVESVYMTATDFSKIQ